MTDLYLDTEFNGHGGELISLALANPTGPPIYVRFPDPIKWHPWVELNVVPKFGIDSVRLITARHKVRIYLQSFEEITIYADWPADFQYLMQVMCGNSFEESFSVPCKMILLNNIETNPVIPHNALSDAVALMKAHRE